MPKKRPDLTKLLKQHWFLLGIFFSILLAVLNPYIGAKGGPLKPEYTVKYGAVSIIFLLSGLTLNTESLHKVFKQYRLHSFIQLFTFVLIPVLVQGIAMCLWYAGVNVWILRGLITVGCMPPPVSSAVILTRAAGGNEAAALFNSVIGSLLGVILTPIILLFSLGSTTVVPLTQSVLQLSATVLLPLGIGRMFARLHDLSNPSPVRTTYTKPIIFGQIALLVVIYTTFCDAFYEHDMAVTATDVLITVILVVLLQAILSGLSFWIAIHQFTPQDTVAAVFCSTHKSLTLGVPILRIMYHGLSHASRTGLPLLIYHPCQLLLGSLIAPSLAKWTKGRRLPL
ncbi:sodium/bile acid cotransporter 7-B-like [Arctopsyche grandis]|uniref:sodium/bile acid cotransporter 7-B-like n=1 Tax=Arctopsyche grandis TaxID=121162 RepID=UPI00406D908A